MSGSPATNGKPQPDRSKLIKDAMIQARKLKRPEKTEDTEAISRRCWLECQEVLVQMCHFLPNIWPAQGPSERTTEGETLVERTGIPLRTLQRHLIRLEDAGLITREARDGHGKWYGTHYTLPWLKGPYAPKSPPTTRQTGGDYTPNLRLVDANLAVTTRQIGVPMTSSLREENEEPLSPSDSTNDDDGSSSSSTSNPAEDEGGAPVPALALGPALAPGEVRVWASERLVSLGVQHEPDEKGWCACGRKHNLWTAPEGCSRCGCDLEALQGYLDGKLPICEDCALQPAAKRQRDADKARLREIKQFEYKQIVADRIKVPNDRGYNLVTWPAGYVFPKWHHQYKPSAQP